MAQMEMAICLVGANLSQMENHLKNLNLKDGMANGTYTILNARHMGLSTRC